MLQIKNDIGAVKPLEKVISYYLGHLSTQQKEVVLSVVKTFAGVDEAWWDDKAYEAEMDRLFAEMETGNVEGCTLEGLEGGARHSYKSIKRT